MAQLPRVQRTGVQRPTLRRRVRIGASVGLTIAALLLSGCAAGQHAQTAAEVAVLDGVQADVGQLHLRDLKIITPPEGRYLTGSNASVQLIIGNSGPIEDQLVSVSAATAATSAALYANPATAGLTSTASDSASATNPASAATSDPASATGSPSATTPVGPAVNAIALPRGENTVIGAGTEQPVIELQGLTAALYPAMSIKLTFTFANAGSITLSVAVQLSSGAVTAPTLATGSTNSQ